MIIPKFNVGDIIIEGDEEGVVTSVGEEVIWVDYNDGIDYRIFKSKLKFLTTKDSKNIWVY